MLENIILIVTSRVPNMFINVAKMSLNFHKFAKGELVIGALALINTISSLGT